MQFDHWTFYLTHKPWLHALIGFQSDSILKIIVITVYVEQQ